MQKKQIIAISGVSGAGKSSMAKVLEDSGFFVVDNLPSQLLEKVVSLADKTSNDVRRLAFVIDAREPNFLKKFPTMWNRLRKSGHTLSLLFLDASDETIIQRYKETRRRHPLERGEGMRESLERERRFLRDIRQLADEVVVTDRLNVHELKELVKRRFTGASDQPLVVTLLSFGFKHGLPQELDLCFDARFLKNPHFVDDLRPLTGLQPKVSRFVLKAPHAKGFLSRVRSLLEYLTPLYQKEGKSYMTVAIGCTGGRHRAPALVAELNKQLSLKNVHVRVEHRDLEK